MTLMLWIGNKQSIHTLHTKKISQKISKWRDGKRDPYICLSHSPCVSISIATRHKKHECIKLWENWATPASWCYGVSWNYSQAKATADKGRQKDLHISALRTVITELLVQGHPLLCHRAWYMEVIQLILLLISLPF